MASPLTLDGSGLTHDQKLALAATMWCRPCGCDGSGSGSGSGSSNTICGCTAADYVRATTLYATVEIDCISITDTVTLNYTGGTCPKWEGTLVVGSSGGGVATSCDPLESPELIDLGFHYAIGISLACVPCTGGTCLGGVTTKWPMSINIEAADGGIVYRFGAPAGSGLFKYHRMSNASCNPMAFNEKIMTAACFIPGTVEDITCFDCCANTPAACSFTTTCTDDIGTDTIDGVGCVITVNISE